jgi:hypothetical protein
MVPVILSYKMRQPTTYQSFTHRSGGLDIVSLNAFI